MLGVHECELQYKVDTIVTLVLFTYISGAEAISKHRIYIYTCTVTLFSTHHSTIQCTLAPFSYITPYLLIFLLHLLPFPTLCSHLWVVCNRNILPTTRSTAPDTAFPDSSTFGTYDNAEDNVPYIASEFDPTAEGINFPYQFGVGDESEPNDFPDWYRNGPVVAGNTLDCFVRYFVSTEVR